MKKILGLDLGTNSIGWALIEQDFDQKQGKIHGMGSRIIPMSQDILGDFGKGNSVSQTSERTRFRSIRRLKERNLLRRQRLHRVLHVLGCLPTHFESQVDFENKLGQFLEGTETKLAYRDSKFLFQKSFSEMVKDFEFHQPHLLKNEMGKNKLIPYDWTIYYLRKKALTQKIEKEELAWIILNFNQKRGYYQLREEQEEENPNKQEELYSLKIIDVTADDPQKGKDEIWYSLILENGWIYRRSSKSPLFDWRNKSRDFIVTTDLNDDGSIKTDKEGKEKRSFRAPGEEDWTLVKKKTEKHIYQSGKTVGTYIYDTLLQNPKQKIRGKLVRTIERHFYKDELKAILKTQQSFHADLQNDEIYNRCVRELYRNNEAHQLGLAKKDIVHLILDDIIFYQRPLKSKKSSISNCSLESRKYTSNDGHEIVAPLKAIPRSHPIFQEFRLWQWLKNLNIYRNEDDTNMNSRFIETIEDYQSLFEFLNNRKEISQETLIKHLLAKTGLKGRALTEEASNYRWNYVQDKVYPCNETRTQIISRLSKILDTANDFLTHHIEHQLWHIIYSVSDKIEYEKALATFASKYQIDTEGFVSNFRKFPPFPSEYGSYSAKAIKKLLPLMRVGTFWNPEEIDTKTKDRINKIITGEVDDSIRDRIREKAIHLTQFEDFQNLPLWLASYVIYNRHSESSNAEKWNTAADLNAYIENFKQHSLRNPIVEQVMTETLRVVRDIWMKYGKGEKDFFSEIHVELGRQMKNTAEERKKITEQVTINENTNLRLKALLIEMLNDATVENVRPYSPMQQEILKIYEEGALSANSEMPDDIEKISRKPEPSKAELQRYKLWLEQKYRSPYTGLTIPLNKLFTTEYEIEHIIPQSRYFDDSFSNKVICETSVNKIKDNQTGMEFIKNYHSSTIELGGGKKVRILDEETYKDFVNEQYSKNRSKRNKLLMEDLPEKMIERQLNDTRYISKFVSSVLSNIVRSDTNDDGLNSKNLIPGNGKITSELRQDWGLNDIWNELILPRFERMNSLTHTGDFTSFNANHQKFLPTVPLELSKNFQKKRIDHRHHALDALVIACATRNHLNYMNNLHALDKTKSKTEKQSSREDLRVLLCNKKFQEGTEKNYKWQFKKPWENFTAEARENLERIIVSFKQNLRVINKATNYYESYKDEFGNLRIGTDGKPKKGFIQQLGLNWAVRKSMHTPMPYGKKAYAFEILKISKNIGKRNLILDGFVKSKIEEALQANQSKISLTEKFLEENPIRDKDGLAILETAFGMQTEKFRRRQPIFELSNRGQGGIKTVDEAKKFINKIADLKIREDLLHHLKTCNNDLEKAFSTEGIEHFNSKRKIPIYKLPIAESGSGRFAVGNTIGTRHKWVEADKGTNLFFAIYIDDHGKRNFETIPLNMVIERQKQGLQAVPERNDKGDRLLYHLSPNDLVYMPDAEETEGLATVNFNNLTIEQINHIYKTVSFTGSQCFFVKSTVASPILNSVEFSSLNKMEKSLEGSMIKVFCLKISIDRIGNIIDGTNFLNTTQSVLTISLSEPTTSYETKKIKRVDSFEEMENDQLTYWAALKPEELFYNLNTLARAAFGIRNNGINNIPNRKIKFD